MKSVLILTKTDWNEPPRIRHQISRLLKEKGYNVHYVEKSSYNSIIPKKRIEEGIKFYRHSELIHHQLRYTKLIQNLNNLVVKFYLKKILKNRDFDCILNFCYDYSFLKEIVKDTKIVTFINDDFEEQAKLGMRKQIKNQLRDTCYISNHIITVSYPLRSKLKCYNNNVTLLFPWSQYHYKVPNKESSRNTVLYFGFVGRINWDDVIKLVKSTEYHFRFVGPIIRKTDKSIIIDLANNNPNFEYIAYSNFEDLITDDVFCSILPYDKNIKSVQACTVSNRAFNLLSKGLPLVYSDLYNLIEAPSSVIRKNKSVEEYKDSLLFFKNNFNEIQPDIKDFLDDHYKNNRWDLLKKIIN
ncbi:hypothetical protein HX109_12645 [Galbibacter sp. BG1]|uniref:hypothetical protein n=1 Tax=Galbibacter sp. BG1 TaxID=1170699 RepID=UPI0015C160B4|nr:hypothetical protein [Galbibacter sp. BG1]QLE02362.1 hypothetical protein HX109_12645 [Galbibacter sp. BG1]